MNAVPRLVAAALCGALGVLLVIDGFAQRRPPLAAAIRRLDRTPLPPSVHPQRWVRWAQPVSRRLRFPATVLADLRLIRRLPEVHGAMLTAASTGALFAPAALLVLAQGLGVLRLGSVIPLAAPLLGAAVAPLLVHRTMRDRAAQVRDDLRHQLSAYLDVVTMLLAANVGNEGALRQGALAGDGRLFVELRRQIVVAETANQSLVVALAQLGDDLELVELQQIAASAALGATIGAPMARSLAAKCATLRMSLAAEQETEARLRTDRITAPLVGMSLLIMAAVVYPALNFAQ